MYGLDKLQVSNTFTCSVYNEFLNQKRDIRLFKYFVDTLQRNLVCTLHTCYLRKCKIRVSPNSFQREEYSFHMKYYNSVKKIVKKRFLSQKEVGSD